MMEPTILIVGAGTFGTSTAFHLAKTYKDPSRVTVIDRSPSPPEPAAAIDVNRVIRTDYASKLYCNLAYEAIHDWFWAIELQAHFHMVGWLMLDEDGSTLSERVQQTFRDRGSDQTEEIALNELSQRYGFLKDTATEGFRRGYFNPTAGWCDAPAATASIMEAVVERGVQRLTADVSELVVENGRLTGVRTDDGKTFTADKIVLAAGAWTSSLLSPVEDKLSFSEKDCIESQIRVTGAVAAYYKIGEEELQELTEAKMPIVVYGQAGEVVPASDNRRILKYSNTDGTFTNTITTSSGRRITAPADQSQYEVPDQLKQETEEQITKKVMPQFAQGKQPEYWRICWDTFTPTEDLLMCQHPALENLYLATGGNFHSYKLVLLCGPSRKANNPADFYPLQESTC